MNQNYARAEQLLTRPFVIPTPSDDVKGKSKEDPRTSNGTVTPGAGLGGGLTGHLDPVGLNGMGAPLTSGFFGGIEVPMDAPTGVVSKLVDMSVACRYLAAQCMVRVPPLFDRSSDLEVCDTSRFDQENGPKPLRLLEKAIRGVEQVLPVARTFHS